MPRRRVDVSGYERQREGRTERVRDYIRMQEAAEGKPIRRRPRRASGVKPTIQKVRVVVADDQDPDLSFLGEYTDSPTSPAAIDRVERGDWERGQLKYFEPGRTDDPGQALQDYERMEAYNRGDWHMVGIYVVADVIVPDESGSAVVQEVRSGGLWGIESDSDKDYRRQVASEELMDLLGQLEALGIDKYEFDDAPFDDAGLEDGEY